MDGAWPNSSRNNAAGYGLAIPDGWMLIRKKAEMDEAARMAASSRRMECRRFGDGILSCEYRE
jgi:hypothetical protein